MAYQNIYNRTRFTALYLMMLLLVIMSLASPPLVHSQGIIFHHFYVSQNIGHVYLSGYLPNVNWLDSEQFPFIQSWLEQLALNERLLVVKQPESHDRFQLSGLKLYPRSFLPDQALCALSVLPGLFSPTDIDFYGNPVEYHILQGEINSRCSQIKTADNKTIPFSPPVKVEFYPDDLLLIEIPPSKQTDQEDGTGSSGVSGVQNPTNLKEYLPGYYHGGSGFEFDFRPGGGGSNLIDINVGFSLLSMAMEKYEGDQPIESQEGISIEVTNAQGQQWRQFYRMDQARELLEGVDDGEELLFRLKGNGLAVKTGKMTDLSEVCRKSLEKVKESIPGIVSYPTETQGQTSEVPTSSASQTPEVKETAGATASGSGVVLGTRAGNGGDDQDAPVAKKRRVGGAEITSLPSETVAKILSNLKHSDVASCRRVCHRWKTIIDNDHIQASAFYRRCHPVSRAPSLLNPAECYRLSIRDSLERSGDEGKKSIEQLDKLLGYRYFAKVLFFSTARVLTKTKAFICENMGSIQHSGWVNDACFSPDGTHFVTASNDNTAKIWGLVGGRWSEKATIHHSGRINNVRFSPDGTHIVTASDDNTAKIWGLVDGQWQEKAIIHHSNDVRDASFSPDGTHLVTISADNTAKIWGLVDEQWQEKATSHHSGRINNASFSPDGTHIVIASGDHTARIWGLVNGRWQKKATIQHSRWVNNACFSPDGTHLVTTSVGGTVKICGLVNGQWQEKTTIQYFHWISNASFSPDGTHLMIISGDHTARIWGLVNEQWQEKTTIHHSGWINNANFSPDGTHLMTASGRTAKIWGLVNGQWQEKATIHHSGWINNASFSPDGTHLVIASADRTARIWGLVDGQWQGKAIIRHSDDVHNARFNPDGTHLVTTSDDNTAKICGLVDGRWQEKATIHHSDGVRNASFSPDGIHLVTASKDNSAKVWLLKSKE